MDKKRNSRIISKMKRLKNNLIFWIRSERFIKKFFHLFVIDIQIFLRKISSFFTRHKS